MTIQLTAREHYALTGLVIDTMIKNPETFQLTKEIVDKVEAVFASRSTTNMSRMAALAVACAYLEHVAAMMAKDDVDAGNESDTPAMRYARARLLASTTFDIALQTTRHTDLSKAVEPTPEKT